MDQLPLPAMDDLLLQRWNAVYQETGILQYKPAGKKQVGRPSLPGFVEQARRDGQEHLQLLAILDQIARLTGQSETGGVQGIVVVNGILQGEILVAGSGTGFFVGQRPYPTTFKQGARSRGTDVQVKGDAQGLAGPQWRQEKADTLGDLLATGR